MPPRLHAGLHAGFLAIACFALAPSVRPAQAAGEAQAPAAAPATVVTPADWQDVKTLLNATNEEWAVIFPQLSRIWALRQDIDSAAETSHSGAAGRMGGPFDSPLGGNSLNAPVMPNRSGRAQAGGSAPFDPKKAPGAPQAATLSGALGGLLVRGLIAALLPDEAHPVRAVLSELKTLIDSHDATDEQIREKLAAVRAVRSKAMRDLQTAQHDLTPYLTVDQTAALVNLGILD